MICGGRKVHRQGDVLLTTANLHSIESFGTVDGPGIRFVAFLKGCPLRCQYCHNPDTWDAKGGRKVTVEELVKEALKYRSYYGDKGGVTVSGGEPLLQIDFVIEFFTALKEKGIHTCVDTSGFTFVPDDEESVRKHEKLLAVTDLFLLDVKHIDAKRHEAITGKSNAHTLAFAKFLSEHGKPMWVRYVLVSSLSDDDEAIRSLKAFLETLSNVEKIEVLPYHTMGKVKYEKLGLVYPLGDEEPPSKERVQNAKQILRG